MIRRIFFVLLLLVGFLYSYPYPHNVKWQRYQTKHFNIYFYDELKSVADQTFDMVEDIYDQVSKELKYSPSDRIELILVDNGDRVNALANYFYQTIVIEVSPVSESDLGPFQKQSLHHLIAHELTHILHLSLNYSSNMVYGLMKRLTSRGFLYPQYLTEGFAVYNEKVISKGGRLYNSYYDEYLMTFVKFDSFPSLVQLSNPSMLRWPGGAAPYILGAKFVDYIASKYGRASLINTFHLFSKDFSIPTFSRAFYKQNSVKIEDLYEEFKDYLRLKYMSLRENETSFNIVLDSGSYNLNPYWDGDDSIIYYKNDLHDDPALIRYNFKTKTSQIIYQNTFFTGKYFIEGEDLYVLLFEQPDLFSTQHVLWKLNLKTGTKQRICDKVQDFTKNDNNLYIVIENVTKNELLEINENTESKILWESEYLDSISIDPDGENLAFVSRKQEKDVLFVYHLVTGKTIEVAEGNIKSTSWDDNGNIIFVADWSGFSQVYSFDIEKKKMKQLSNFNTGVYYPQVVDNKMLFSTIGEKGYIFGLVDDVQAAIVSNNYIPPKDYVDFQMEFEPISSNVEEEMITLSPYAYIFEEKFERKAKDYNQLNLNLLYFIPFITVSNYGSYVGFSTLMTDPLQFQQLFMNYWNSSGDEVFELQYLNTSIYPFVSLSAAKRIDEESYLGIFSAPMIVGEAFHNFSFGMQQKLNGFKNLDNYYYASYAVNQYKYYRHSISPEKGFSNELIVKKHVSKEQNTYYDNLVTYLPGLGVNHVLKVDFTYGYSQDTDFRVGGWPQTIYVRGYNFWDTKQGSAVGRVSLEYKYPMFIIDNNWMFNYYVYQVVGTFFVDYADAASRSVLFKDPQYSTGFMVNTSGLQMNLVPLELGIGVATTPKKDVTIILYLGAKI